MLVIHRFDRRGGVRTGYASAKTMLEARDGDRRSYLEIAAVIEERFTTVTEELRQLWRRMAFTILISNTDDHLRNHGFLHGHEVTRAVARWRHVAQSAGLQQRDLDLMAPAFVHAESERARGHNQGRIAASTWPGGWPAAWALGLVGREAGI